MNKDHPIVEKQEEIYQGFFDVRVEYLKRKEKVTTYGILDLKADGACVLAEKEGKYLILEEYRHPLKQYIYGAPGGRVEKGEDIYEGAKREFLEETGYEINSLEFIGTSQPLPSICDHKIHLFYSKNIQKKGEPHRDAFEYIEMHFLSEKEIFEKIKQKKIIDGTLIHLLFYKNFLSK